jgi:hypothetical protein
MPFPHKQIPFQETAPMKEMHMALERKTKDALEQLRYPAYALIVALVFRYTCNASPWFITARPTSLQIVKRQCFDEYEFTGK